MSPNYRLLEQHLRIQRRPSIDPGYLELIIDHKAPSNFIDAIYHLARDLNDGHVVGRHLLLSSLFESKNSHDAVGANSISYIRNEYKKYPTLSLSPLLDGKSSYLELLIDNLVKNEVIDITIADSLNNKIKSLLSPPSISEKQVKEEKKAVSGHAQQLAKSMGSVLGGAAIPAAAPTRTADTPTNIRPR